MEHDKSHLPRAVDLEAHMKVKRARDARAARMASLRRESAFWTSTLHASGKTEAPRERNVREYVTGIIDHDEYERREGIRLAREAAPPLSGTAA